MSINIDKYANFGLDQIDEFMNVGIQISNDPDKIIFTKYCRNFINFILNFSNFNFLFEYLSDINRKIFNRF